MKEFLEGCERAARDLKGDIACAEDLNHKFWMNHAAYMEIIKIKTELAKLIEKLRQEPLTGTASLWIDSINSLIPIKLNSDNYRLIIANKQFLTEQLHLGKLLTYQQCAETLLKQYDQKLQNAAAKTASSLEDAYIAKLVDKKIFWQQALKYLEQFISEQLQLNPDSAEKPSDEHLNTMCLLKQKTQALSGIRSETEELWQKIESVPQVAYQLKNLNQTASLTTPTAPPIPVASFDVSCIEVTGTIQATIVPLIDEKTPDFATQVSEAERPIAAERDSIFPSFSWLRRLGSLSSGGRGSTSINPNEQIQTQKIKIEQLLEKLNLVELSDSEALALWKTKTKDFLSMSLFSLSSHIDQLDKTIQLGELLICQYQSKQLISEYRQKIDAYKYSGSGFKEHSMYPLAIVREDQKKAFHKELIAYIETLVLEHLGVENQSEKEKNSSALFTNLISHITHLSVLSGRTIAAWKKVTAVREQLNLIHERNSAGYQEKDDSHLKDGAVTAAVTEEMYRVQPEVPEVPPEAVQVHNSSNHDVDDDLEEKEEEKKLPREPAFVTFTPVAPSAPPDYDETGKIEALSQEFEEIVTEASEPTQWPAVPTKLPKQQQVQEKEPASPPRKLALGQK